MTTVPCLVGPTGIGKTEVAVELALHHGLDIISADSRQVYRLMDIGTAKPSPKLRTRIQFHLLDVAEPDELFSAGDYARLAHKAIEGLRSKDKRFLLVGGSGLYLKALFEPFFAAPPVDLKRRAELQSLSTERLRAELESVDADAARRIHPHDRQRTARALEVYYASRRPLSEHRAQKEASDLEPRYVGLHQDRKTLYHRINERFDAMLASGLVDEVKRLAAAGYLRDLYAFNAFGYREMLDFVEGRLPLAEATRRAKQKTRAYARRQLTWFRRVAGIRWVEYTTLSETVCRVEEILKPVLV